MTDLFIPSSTGTVITPADRVASGADGTDVFAGWVTRPVPGQLLQTRGLGQFGVEHVGIRGSLTAEVITGVAGTARALVKLTSDLISPPRDTIQLSLDTQNRPVLTIAYDGAASITATVPGGPALPAGVIVQVRVVWDSVTPLSSGSYVDFKLLSGAAVPGTMGTIPAGSWATVPMRYVRVGFGVNLGDFNGTILSIQVGEQRM